MLYRIDDLKKIKDRIDKTVYEYSLPGRNWNILKLKKGSIAGEHYHKGISPLKNPETLLFIEGKVELFVQDLHTKKRERISIEAPKLIRIEAFVYHEMRVLDDTILLEQFDNSSLKDRFELTTYD